MEELTEKFDINVESDTYKKAELLIVKAYKVLSEPLQSTIDSLAIAKLREQASTTQQLMTELVPWKNTVAELEQSYSAKASVHYGKMARSKEISPAERDGYIEASASSIRKLSNQLNDMYALAMKRMSLAQTLIKAGDYVSYQDNQANQVNL